MMFQRFRFRQFGVLLCFIMLVISINSCKKSEPDDPNIIYKKIDKSVKAVFANLPKVDSFDLNDDAHIDFKIAAISNAAADTAVTIIFGESAAVYCDSAFVYSSFFFKVKNLYEQEIPDIYNGSKRWWDNVYVTQRSGSNKTGYAGVGDVYLPIIITISSPTDFHYGWLHVQAESDYRSLTVIDGAYHVQANVPIKMGAK